MMIVNEVLFEPTKGEHKYKKDSNSLYIIDSINDYIRNYLLISDIFLISDRNKVWRAILNNAMNARNVIIANSEIGSIGYLINQMNNRILYHNDKGLLKSVKNLC